jgi:hypothetical protein
VVRRAKASDTKYLVNIGSRYGKAAAAVVRPAAIVSRGGNQDQQKPLADGVRTLFLLTAKGTHGSFL